MVHSSLPQSNQDYHEEEYFFLSIEANWNTNVLFTSYSLIDQILNYFKHGY